MTEEFLRDVATIRAQIDIAIFSIEKHNDVNFALALMHESKEELVKLAFNWQHLK